MEDIFVYDMEPVSFDDDLENCFPDVKCTMLETISEDTPYHNASTMYELLAHLKLNNILVTTIVLIADMCILILD